MMNCKKLSASTAGLNGFMAIVLGAVAAHAIADPHAAEMAQKASFYQLVHAVALLVFHMREGKYFCWARSTFLMGIILFCGSLYLRALTGWVEVTQVAPAGGFCFMAGWLLIALACYKEA